MDLRGILGEVSLGRVWEGAELGSDLMGGLFFFLQGGGSGYELW